MINNDKEELKESEVVFIPLIPQGPKRLIIMLSAFIPGFILLLAAFNKVPVLIVDILLMLLSITIGVLVITVSIKKFIKPASVNFIGIDTLLLFTGLMIIAQSATGFDPYRGFYFVHLYFIAGCFAIFKAVMFPESKAISGFLISGDKIRIRKRLFFPTKEFSSTNITSVEKSGTDLIFRKKLNDNITVSVRGYEFNDNLLNVLRESVSERTHK